MPIYQRKAHEGKYVYRFRYSEGAEGWQIDAAQVLVDEEPLTEWRKINGAFASEAEAVARGLEWCEAIVAHLNTDNVPSE